MPQGINVKAIHIAPIKSNVANDAVKKWHYSGKVVHNSSLHLGAFYNGVLCGVMSFGPPMDKSKVLGLVKGTTWNGMLELNRMAFSDVLPKNSESRSLAIAFKIIKKTYPFIKWILSFSDACQCGDGAIYRASGFVLTGIKKNTCIIQAPDGTKTTQIILSRPYLKQTKDLAKKFGVTLRASGSVALFKQAGFKPLVGYQLRYIKFLDPAYQDKLTVPIIPFSKIRELAIGMYKGKYISRGENSSYFSAPKVEGGADPTSPLQ